MQITFDIAFHFLLLWSLAPLALVTVLSLTTSFYLATRHKEVWRSIGRPPFLSFASREARSAYLRFQFKGDHKRLGDSLLSFLVRLTNTFGAAATIGFGSLMVLGLLDYALR